MVKHCSNVQIQLKTCNEHCSDSAFHSREFSTGLCLRGCGIPTSWNQDNQDILNYYKHDPCRNHIWAFPYREGGGRSMDHTSEQGHQTQTAELQQLNSNRHSPTNTGTFPLFIFKPEIFLRHIGTHIIKDILLAVETQIYSTALS